MPTAAHSTIVNAGVALLHPPRKSMSSTATLTVPATSTSGAVVMVSALWLAIRTSHCLQRTPRFRRILTPVDLSSTLVLTAMSVLAATLRLPTAGHSLRASALAESRLWPLVSMPARPLTTSTWVWSTGVSAGVRTSLQLARCPRLSLTVL